MIFRWLSIKKSSNRTETFSIYQMKLFVLIREIISRTNNKRMNIPLFNNMLSKYTFISFLITSLSPSDSNWITISFSNSKKKTQLWSTLMTGLLRKKGIHKKIAIIPQVTSNGLWTSVNKCLIDISGYRFLICRPKYSVAVIAYVIGRSFINLFLKSVRIPGFPEIDKMKWYKSG